MSDSTRSRREFLRSSGGCALATISACALAGAHLGALPIRTVAGVTSGQERQYDVPGIDSVNIDHVAQTILVRYQGHVFGMSLGCPHEHAAVRWVEKDHRFQCTKHDSRYQEDGVHISGRATRNLDRFGIRRSGDRVVLELERVFQSDTDPAGWANAVIAL
jgi:nitrite reductase/ring-hydroxylating ferredoxin subunit